MILEVVAVAIEFDLGHRDAQAHRPVGSSLTGNLDRNAIAYLVAELARKRQVRTVADPVVYQRAVDRLDVGFERRRALASHEAVDQAHARILDFDLLRDERRFQQNPGDDVDDVEGAQFAFEIVTVSDLPALVDGVDGIGAPTVRFAALDFEMHAVEDQLLHAESTPE